ncbi:AMP-binding protein [Streptomyces sp. NBC_00893]|uniref:AMP-binding protein n=1 Tax=Streptomyces sp. NBC_00893 TaxID=2975862 RepID=UPI002253E7BB|nr:AMP-binding protein [Streptomyces sp. NBC_00893]MCX4850458.1 AMP-binding protein [Streptomyces sp. NBC_00893]
MNKEHESAGAGRETVTPFPEAPLLARPLPDIVWDRASADPEGLAVVELGERGDTTMTWRELVDRAERIAHVLLALGVRPGETVMVQLPNSAAFVAASLAALRIGAVCCPVLPALGQRELEYALQRSDARVLFVPEEFRKRRYAQEVRFMAEARRTGRLAHVLVVAEDSALAYDGDESGTGVVFHDLVRSTAAARPAEHPPVLGPDTVAHLLFTSGTTGEPKGVPHRMGTLNRAALLMSRRLGLTRRDRWHIASPMAHHSGFLYGMWVALLLGGVQVLQPVWDADRALEAFTRWRSTFMQGATPFLLDMVDAVDAGVPPPQSLSTFVITGASVPRALSARARSSLGIRVCAGWGSTETCFATLSAPGDDEELVTATDGRSLDGVRLRVVGEAGRPLGPGDEGDLQVTGPCLFEGYLGRPDLTEEAFTADGWYRTGDLAVIEPTGYLRITGRVKDVINRGGEKIPVGDIEQLLMTHPAVRDAAVVAMPDRRLGERACLFAVLSPGGLLDLTAMQIFLEGEKVAKHYWPERVEIMDALPRNPAGKVQKFILRQLAKGATGRRTGEDDGI